MKRRVGWLEDTTYEQRLDVVSSHVFADGFISRFYTDFLAQCRCHVGGGVARRPYAWHGFWKR